jgi:hypothetical protein
MQFLRSAITNRKKINELEKQVEVHEKEIEQLCHYVMVLSNQMADMAVELERIATHDLHNNVSIATLLAQTQVYDPTLMPNIKDFKKN